MMRPVLKNTHMLLILVLSFTTTVATVTAQEDRTRRIRFARGSSTAVVEDAVIRGTRDRYLLKARAGQTMTVRITSVEDNAEFDIYPSRGKKPLEGAYEVTDWTGKLPRSGDYVIEVGPTRGNASYRLEVTIR